MNLLKKNTKWYLLATLFLVNIFIWNVVSTESRDGTLTVAFLDVGQGDAVFIESPTGKQVLIDAGPNRTVLKELSKVMPFYDRSIDVVFATHPDKDHVGGLPAVLGRYDVDFFVDSGVVSYSNVYRELENMLEKNNVKKILARRRMKFVLSDDVYLLILFPDRDVSSMDTNDASIVAKLVYGDSSFLLMGDSPKKMENYLISLDAEGLDVNVLKAGHHGSKTSSSESFIGYTNPEYAVISVGKDNRYGHPHREVLTLLDKFEIPVLRTDALGSIIFTSNGEKIRVRY